MSDLTYVIVEGSSRTELIKNVQGYIERGYKPQGGVAIQNSGSIGLLGCYWQAMIKEIDKNLN